MITIGLVGIEFESPWVREIVELCLVKKARCIVVALSIRRLRRLDPIG
jgi:hypothetical protein